MVRQVRTARNCPISDTRHSIHGGGSAISLFQLNFPIPPPALILDARETARGSGEDAMFRNYLITALRNLMRGKRMGLPSGQNVARKMGIPVIPDEKLLVGKATKDGNKIGSDGKKANPELVSIHPAFKGNAPLWYYILAEAQQAFVDNDTPIRLGPVGGRIVGEVFVGLMLGDGHSYLAQQPEWQPLEKLSRQGVFGITELISAAIA